MQEGVPEILFELSSQNRLSLLLAIQDGKLRLTQLSKKISANIQETSRHLERLSDSKLVHKDSDGFYFLTTFGGLILDFFPSLEFLCKNRDYFLSHDLTSLPSEFIHRLGELSVHEYQEGISNALSSFERVVSTANEYVWVMSDQPLLRFSGDSFQPQRIRMKAILAYEPDNIQYPIESLKKLGEPPDHLKKLGERFELGLVEGIKIGISMNEKVAGVAFAGSDGKVDLNSGFGSDNLQFHKWCHDLFIFCWGRARKSSLSQVLSSIGRE